MNLRVLDLFCGGGGSSWGAKNAGAEIACGIDAWDIAINTYNDNFKDHGINSIISDFSEPSQISSLGPFDLILASPECTNHTCARGNRPINEESRLTAKYVLKYMNFFRPRWAIFENVYQMRYWHYYDELLDTIDSLGYHIMTQIIDACDFGVPQMRKRLFILCDREKKPREVKPSQNIKQKVASTILDPEGIWKYSPLYTEKRAKNTLLRAERAISELPMDEDFLLVYYGSDSSGGWQCLSKPLRTLTTLDRFALVRRNAGSPMMRMLQVPELRRAMGFDQEYKLNFGTRRDKVKLMGNGVCPPVMEAIVRSLIFEN